MSQVTTQGQANQLNRDGTYGPYLAFNGHLLVAPVERPIADDAPERDADGERIPWSRRERRGYRVGDEIRYLQHAARCTDRCRACAGGEPLPDW